MTVKELIDELSVYPDNIEVLIHNMQEGYINITDTQHYTVVEKGMAKHIDQIDCLGLWTERPVGATFIGIY